MKYGSSCLLCDREEFERWSPPVGSLPEADKTGKMMLVIVTITGPPEKGFIDKDGTPYDFVSRSFAPWTGVPEDPVTGELAHIHDIFKK